MATDDHAGEPMHPSVQDDPWADLRAFTTARLALGRCGAALPTAEVLRFGLAHAQARDAVHVPLDVEALCAALRAGGREVFTLASAAPDRATYLLRPDLGRRLAPASAEAVRALPQAAHGADLLLVVGDGLSALAVQRHAPALVDAIVAQAPAGWTIAPIVVATQARVALADAVGEALGARHVAMLIGERPGLGAADSLGIYLTAAPRVGRRDAERNCISNVRDAGLPPREAARRLWWLCQAAVRLGRTGVDLKDASTALPGEGGTAVLGGAPSGAG